MTWEQIVLSLRRALADSSRVAPVGFAARTVEKLLVDLARSGHHIPKS